jgi:hypothetical protein
MRKNATKGRMQANDAANAHRAGMARGQYRWHTTSIAKAWRWHGWQTYVPHRIN